MALYSSQYQKGYWYFAKGKLEEGETVRKADSIMMW